MSMMPASAGGYKNTYPQDMVRAIILQGAGIQFDPLVTNAFMACEQTVVDIFNQLQG